MNNSIKKKNTKDVSGQELGVILESLQLTLVLKGFNKAQNSFFFELKQMFLLRVKNVPKRIRTLLKLVGSCCFLAI